MTPEALLDLFHDTAAAVRAAVTAVPVVERRARTDRAGQYALDLVADAAALAVLGKAPAAVLSEESGRSGPAAAPVTVVMDPVDGSTNCSRDLPYWATSLCALDADGPVASLVVNQATGVTTTAIRGGGTRRDGAVVRVSGVTAVEKAIVALSGRPRRFLDWKQSRTLGCCALALCDVAAGNLDAYVDGGNWHAPWDYLGGVHACLEAGAMVTDLAGRPLAVADGDARRQVLAAATADLQSALRPALEA